MRLSGVAIVFFITVSCSFAGSITVGTSAAATATYGSVGESAGPFPWSDLGITASASVSGGGLSVATGGSTSYSFLSSLTGGESFTPGATSVNLGYTPGWTGSIATLGAANGDFNSALEWNIGPFSGSHS